MATKREYLIERGLAKPGRGRFSNEAKAVLAAAEAAGVVFDEPVKSEPVKSETDEEPAPRRPSLPAAREQARASLIKPSKIMREYTCMLGTTDDGLTVEFGDCQRCAERVQYCECKSGPHAPAGLTNLRPSDRVVLST